MGHPDRFDSLEECLRKAVLQLSQEGSLTNLPRAYQQYAEQSFANALRSTLFVVSQQVTATQVVSDRLLSDVMKFALAARTTESAFTWRAACVSNSSRHLRGEAKLRVGLYFPEPIAGSFRGDWIVERSINLDGQLSASSGLLVLMSDAEHSGLVEMTREDLQADGQAFG